MQTVKKIIEDFLKENGFDGLCAFECGCRIGDLAPCGGCNILDCAPGFLVVNDNGDNLIREEAW